MSEHWHRTIRLFGKKNVCSDEINLSSWFQVTADAQFFLTVPPMSRKYVHEEPLHSSVWFISATYSNQATYTFQFWKHKL